MKFRSFAKQAVQSGPAKSIGVRLSIVNYHLAPYLGSMELEDIAPQNVAGVLDHVRESGVSESHVRSVLQTLRAIMQQALQERRIFSDPTQGFRVKVPKAEVSALTPAQRDALDDVLKTQTPWTSAQPLRVMLWTGLRISEVLALEPWDFNTQDQTLRVRQGKTDAAARIVDVPDCAATTVQNYLDTHYRPHQTTIRRALSAACQEAGVPPIRVHDLRHTRITTLLMAGVPVGYVSKQAGHADPSTTLAIYDQWVKVAEQTQRRAWANS